MYCPYNLGHYIMGKIPESQRFVFDLVRDGSFTEIYELQNVWRRDVGIPPYEICFISVSISIVLQSTRQFLIHNSQFLIRLRQHEFQAVFQEN